VESTLFSKTLEFESPRQLSQLYSGKESHLSDAEKALGVHLVSRDDWRKIEGAEANVHNAGELFEMLLSREVGVVNTMLGLDVPWLVEPTMARWSLVVASAWNLIGFNILFYIAGLQNVPDDVQEAAAIDGANAIQRFFYVTFPLLSPFTFFLVVTNTIYALFETFGMIDVLTQGGPLRSTYTAMYNVFKIGIEGQDLGKATAQSLVLLVIVVAITIIQFRVSRDRISYTV